VAATRTRSQRRVELSDEDLAEVLALSSGSDSVELKLTVPDADHRSAIEALQLDPLDAQIRLVSFFDTPDLTLNQRGVIVRARRVQGREDDTVVKLRPVVPDELPEELRSTPGMLVELDAMPGGYVCSASLKARLSGASEVRKRVAGKRSTRKLFSKPQRAFYKAHAPEGLELDDLTLLGPIFVLKINSTPRRFGRKLVSELWLYPDGSRILELSTKCPPKEMFQVAAEARAFLTGLGIDLSGQQQTKTKSALEQFSRRRQLAG
jgi:hypothetical protein